MIQKQDQDDLDHQQCWPQAEGQGGDEQLGWKVEDKAQPRQPPTQWLTPPKCWLHGVEIQTEVKCSENPTFLTSEVVEHSVVLRILVSAVFSSCDTPRTYYL